jgi:hypothetical protein
MSATLASLEPAKKCRNYRLGLDVGAAAMNGRKCSWERRERDRERERERDVIVRGKREISQALH